MAEAMRPLSERDPRVARPLYTIAEAARYLDVPTSTLHYWARPPEAPPLITIFPVHGHMATIPFIGFAEAFVIKAALDAGVPRSRIRPSVEKIKARAGGVAHALASRIVYTDGAELLLEEMEDDDLVVSRNEQRQFREAVRSQLKLIEYGNSGYAERIRLPRYKRAHVIVDPHIAAGKPLVEAGVGVRIKDLIDRVHAGDTRSHVARDFGVPLKQIEEIVG
jgi:uncharacterized protein (DUF433 family)